MQLSVRTASLFGGVTAAVASVVPFAHAGTFSSAELSYDNALLSQFNVTTLGNLTQAGGTTTIAGRAIIGGNATFSGSPTVCTGSCTGNAANAIDATGTKLGALTVFGNLVTPGSNYSMANLGVGAGDVSVKGSSSGNILMNTQNGAVGSFRINGSAQSSTNLGNATSIKTTQPSFTGGSYTVSNGNVTGYGVAAQVNQTLASVFPFSASYQSAVKSLATGLAALPGSPGVKAQTLTVGNGIFFTADNGYSIGGKKYGVVTTTFTNLANETNFKGVDNGNNDATFIIVTGDGTNYTLPSLSSYAGSNKVIFDFVDATTLKFSGNWSGSILAPLANITSMGGAIDGSIIVNSINQSQALYATNLFVGDLTGLVPEPPSAVVFGTGVAALIAIRILRRNRRVAGNSDGGKADVDGVFS